MPCSRMPQLLVTITLMTLSGISFRQNVRILSEVINVAEIT